MDMPSAIKLRHIRLFLAVADHGSLTAAGRAQGLSQPAVSKSLAEMEALLGARLMQRQGRRVDLAVRGGEDAAPAVGRRAGPVGDDAARGLDQRDGGVDVVGM